MWATQPVAACPSLPKTAPCSTSSSSGTTSTSSSCTARKCLWRGRARGRSSSRRAATRIVVGWWATRASRPRLKNRLPAISARRRCSGRAMRGRVVELSRRSRDRGCRWCQRGQWSGSRGRVGEILGFKMMKMASRFKSTPMMYSRAWPQSKIKSSL